MEDPAPPSTASRPSLTSIGRFRIIERIGAGGMGEVYKAYDAQLERHVAIKVLAPDTFSDPAAHARLIREARTASQLNHTNICTIYDAGESEGHTYIAMELVQGQSLHERLRSGPLAPDEVERYGLQLTDALIHAHERGVVHRDLKSANVIASGDGRIKVLDFGLAKQVAGTALPEASTRFATTITQPGVLSGTLAYMAPELFRSVPADVRSDIWALGILLYEMSAGRFPFAGETPYELIAAILNSEPRSVPGSVPAPLADTIRRCLEKEPDARFQTAVEVRRALQDDGRKVAPTQSLLRIGLSRRAVASIAAALMLVALATAVSLGPIRRRVQQLVSRDVLAFAERDWLLVSSFNNDTGDAVFDRTLDTALAVGMSQSTYVNLVPGSRIEGALRRMKRPPTSGQLDAPTAREIAQREGIKLVLVPSIAELGGVYQLSGALQDPATGTTLKSAVVRASRENVLSAVDQLIGEIRRGLGEATRSIADHGRPLADVTTDSLEALKVFSAGDAAFRSGQIDAAITLFGDALRLDPRFTMARSQLGILQFELRDHAKGIELLNEAINGLDGLTERERMSVLAYHARAIDQPEKAIEYYQAYLTMYPDSASAYNNLGRVYMQMERWQEAVPVLKRAIELDPDTMPTYYSLNEVYVDHLGELDAAIALSQQQITYNDQIEFPYSFMGWSFLGKGDYSAARNAFEKALALNPRNAVHLFRIGYTYRSQGRYSEARDAFLKALVVDPSYYGAHYDAGVASQLMGDTAGAHAHFIEYRRRIDELIKRNPRYANPYLSLAAVLWRLDERDAAVAAAQRGMALDSRLHYQQALFLALEDRRTEAIAALQRAVDNGFSNFVLMRVDFESLASEPDFRAILQRGLKQ